MNLEKIIDKIINTSLASREEIQTILNATDNKYLFSKSNEVKKRIFGKYVHIRGIIEFSNYCRCSCTYCGINCNNSSVVRYRMSPDEVVLVADNAIKSGYKTIVLQSGEDLYYDKEKVTYIIKRIKTLNNVAITLSIGERSFEDYKEWKENGADRYLLKHETADEYNYNYMHEHSSFKRRIECLDQLKSLGYQLGSGFMVGLPNQTIDSVADDILLLKKYDVDMAGIGVFMPHPATGLKYGFENVEEITLKAVAIARILLKRPHLPATTSLIVCNNNNQLNAFNAGANVIMKKLEPYEYRKLYEIYPNPCISEKSIEEERKELENNIKNMGLYVSSTKGDAIKL